MHNFPISRKLIVALCIISTAGCFLIITPQFACAGSWITDGESIITINSTNYDANCSKITGLCDFYDKQGNPLLTKAGDIYVGLWDENKVFEQRQEGWYGKYDGYEGGDFEKKSNYDISSYGLNIDGSTAVLVFSQGSSETTFDTTYTFDQNDTRVSVNGKINYLVQKDVTAEIIRTTVPDAFARLYIDPFEQPDFSGDTQHDNMDSTTGWSTVGNATRQTNTDPNYIKEGTASIKLNFFDNQSPIANPAGMRKTYTAVDYSDKNWLTFWFYPKSEMRLTVYLYSGAGWRYISTKWYPPDNTWKLFQWEFKKRWTDEKNFDPSGIDKIGIFSYDCNDGFIGSSAQVYVDDIKFSENITDGDPLSWPAGFGGWSCTSGQVYVDSSAYSQGNASLKWANVDINTTIRAVFQYAADENANPDLPADISDYDYIVFDVCSDCNAAVYVEIQDNLLNHKYSADVPTTSTWKTVWWDFKNAYRGYQTDDTNVIRYRFVAMRKAGAESCNIRFDNFHLVKYNDDCPVFDGETYQFHKYGKAVKYSPRVFVMDSQTYIYGDNFGASNIEKMEKNAGYQSIDAYIYNVDMHTLTSTVHRDNVERGLPLVFYKEIVKDNGESSEGTVVYDFQTSQPPEVIKFRWPRNFKAAYTIAEDDFFFKEAAAFYYGTSDINSADYGQKGIAGHNLRTTNNLWATDFYWNNPEILAFFDDMFNDGIEIGMHTPGYGPDNRAVADTVLNRVSSRYGTRHWEDHATSVNPEDFERLGTWRTVDGNSNDCNDGYYMLDLLKKYNFKYCWPNCSASISADKINLFDNDFYRGWPLPRRSYLMDVEPGNPIYVFGRTHGNGYAEFMDLAGNITNIQNMINQNGVTIVYTHVHIGFYDTDGNDYVLKGDVDNVFAWLENRQNDGTLWIDTASNIFDWMLDNENVVITARTANLFTVKNNNDTAVSGITLKDLNNNIKYAKMGDNYLIYVNGSYVVLPRFAPNEQKTVQIVPGTYDSNLPVLNSSSIPVHVNVDNAVYNACTGIVSLAFDYLEPCDPCSPACNASTKDISLSVQHYRHPFFNPTNDSTSTLTSTGHIILSAALTADPTTFNAVDMEIIPSANSVDVSIDTWNTSGAGYKKWTESGNSPDITTTHTVGDLQADLCYQVRVDDSIIEPLLQADENGRVSFVYAGGYTTPVTITVLLFTDFNSDNNIDFGDLYELTNSWLNPCSEPDWCAGTDVDHSGRVDFIDFALLAQNWLWEN